MTLFCLRLLSFFVIVHLYLSLWFLLGHSSCYFFHHVIKAFPQYRCGFSITNLCNNVTIIRPGLDCARYENMAIFRLGPGQDMIVSATLLLKERILDPLYWLSTQVFHSFSGWINLSVHMHLMEAFTSINLEVTIAGLLIMMSCCASELHTMYDVVTETKKISWHVNVVYFEWKLNEMSDCAVVCGSFAGEVPRKEARYSTSFEGCHWCCILHGLYVSNASSAA